MYKEPSIGQFFKILYHHKKTLQVVWPITTNDTKPYKECIKAFVDRFNEKKVKIQWKYNEVDCHVNSDNDEKIIDDTMELLSEIYNKENLDYLGLGLKESDISVDITGGTRSFTVGLVLGALSSERNIQYVSQLNSKEIISLSRITPVIVFDKIARFLNDILEKDNETNRLK